MRLAALDVGDARIGLAVCDELGLTVRGVGVVRRVGGVRDLEEIAARLAPYEPAQIVVGLPLNMDGTEGRRPHACGRSRSALGAHLGLPIELWDERLTTVEAEQTLRAAGVSRVAAARTRRPGSGRNHSRILPGAPGVTRRRVIVAAGVLAAAARRRRRARLWLLDRRGPALAEPVTIAIQEGERLPDVARQLAGQGRPAVAVALRRLGASQPDRTGTSAGASSASRSRSRRAELLARITGPPDALHAVTIPEGLTVREVRRLPRGGRSRLGGSLPGARSPTRSSWPPRVCRRRAPRATSSRTPTRSRWRPRPTACCGR